MVTLSKGIRGSWAVCKHCGKDFQKYTARNVYCSTLCNDKAQKVKGGRVGSAVQRTRMWRHTSKGYLSRFVERARMRTPDTDVTLDWLMGLLDQQNGRCAVSEIPFVFENAYDCFHNPLAPSIDRIDSKRGYYKDNVQLLLSCVNRMKNDLPNQDFLNLWDEIVKKALMEV